MKFVKQKKPAESHSAGSNYLKNHSTT